MKKISKLIAILLIFAIATFVGCNNVSNLLAKNGDTVVLTVTDDVEVGTTLLDYMQSIKGGEVLSSYTIENGMVTEINGALAKGNVYWMLFTDDGENSNETWGTVTVNGKVYASASLGAELLKIKKGCTYIWVAQAF